MRQVILCLAGFVWLSNCLLHHFCSLYSGMLQFGSLYRSKLNFNAVSESLFVGYVELLIF